MSVIWEELFEELKQLGLIKESDCKKPSCKNRIKVCDKQEIFPNESLSNNEFDRDGPRNGDNFINIY